MRQIITGVFILAVLYIAMMAAGACAARPLAEIIHGPAPQITEYNTYDNSRETHVLSDNTVKFFSDLKLASDNKLNSENKRDSDNSYATTNNNAAPSSDAGGALVLFAAVAVLALMGAALRVGD